jgi:hypothetical protein
MKGARLLDGRWPEWMDHYVRVGAREGRVTLDGIGDPPSYARASRKVLFVLKEPNNREDDDARWELQTGPHGMWHAVARWAATILATEPLTYDVANRFEMKQQALRQVAAINLKKVSGGSQSDMNDINLVTYRDREVLRAQIKEIAPEVVVACGTFAQLVWLLGLRVSQTAPLSSPAVGPEDRYTVLPFRHPARSQRKHYADLARLAGMLPRVKGPVPHT